MGLHRTLAVSFSLLTVCLTIPPHARAQQVAATKPAQALRIATYNVSLNRPLEGKLAEDLLAASEQAAAVAAVIRAVQPDILLLNEIDFSVESDNAKLFDERYLSTEKRDSLGNSAWPMKFHYASSVNTGTPSELDLDLDGKFGEPEDAFGFGRFPGHYGMAVLSRYEIAEHDIVTLQNFLWSKLPGALRPMKPDSAEPFYNDATWNKLRLSSKSFWDVPINTPQGRIHILASHPTPPAFDGPEDRNGCRNHDEIKLITSYIEASPALRNDRDQAINLSPESAFVILGDLNCDPHDGDSRNAAIRALLTHQQVAQFAAPESAGAIEASKQQGKANATHRGNPAEDTADFADSGVGNLRADYALPSRHFKVLANGVFWPNLEDVAKHDRAAIAKLLAATDHHLVWVDVQLTEQK